MSIERKLTQIAENMSLVYDAGFEAGAATGGGGSYDEGYAAGVADGERNGFETGTEYGKQTAYDEYWDHIQQNGKRTNYRMFFAGEAWDDTTFKPKYNITCSWADRIFQLSQITDLKGILEERGLTIDFRNAAKNNVLSMMVDSSKITRLPVVDCSLLPNNNTHTFYRANNLVSIDKWILKSDGLQIINETNTFQDCTSLKDIVIEGVIWRSLSFQWCPLSRASLESVMAALTDTVQLAQVLTLNKAAVEAAFTTEEWETMVASKPNWTITLSA